MGIGDSHGQQGLVEPQNILWIGATRADSITNLSRDFRQRRRPKVIGIISRPPVPEGLDCPAISQTYWQNFPGVSTPLTVIERLENGRGYIRVKSIGNAHGDRIWIGYQGHYDAGFCRHPTMIRRRLPKPTRPPLEIGPMTLDILEVGSPHERPIPKDPDHGSYAKLGANQRSASAWEMPFLWA